jgi:tRNA-specific 2-thiouridylase
MTTATGYSAHLTPKASDSRILVGLSGGPRSLLAAALLHSQGLELRAAHLVLHDQGADPRREAMERFCAKLEIPLEIVACQDRFVSEVVDFIVHERLKNRAPAVWAVFYETIVFRELFRIADQRGCSGGATGHMAQVIRDGGSGIARLYPGADPSEDQSYYLCGLSQAQLLKLALPVGGLSAAQLTKLEKEVGIEMRIAESAVDLLRALLQQDLSWMEPRVSHTLRGSGAVRTRDGQMLGEHAGLFRYELGQKLGPQDVGHASESWFVVGFDSGKNHLIAGLETALQRRGALASQANWLHPIDQLRGLRTTCRFQPSGEQVACRVTHFEDQLVQIEFDSPQREVAPGRPVVFYEGQEILGGARIERPLE